MFDGFSPDHQLSVKELIFGGCIRKGGWQGASLRNFARFFEVISRYDADEGNDEVQEEEDEAKKEKKEENAEEEKGDEKEDE